MNTDFELGFIIELPQLRVPFGISPSALETLLEGKCKKINTKYYAMPCIALSGLETQIGFHFLETQWGPRLNEFEVFFDDNEDFEKSFPERQKYLERSLGIADVVQDTKMKAFKFYKWEIGSTIVEHFLRDRFGLEERISFVNNSCTTDAPR